MFGDREGPSTRQVVSVDSVNAEKLVATGITQHGTRVPIALSMMFGGIMNIPSLGDQWLVEKIMGHFVLVAKIGFQDERRMLDLGPGDTVLGLRGRTHVFGSEVVVDSPSGISSGEVDLSDPPRLTLSTTQPFTAGAGSTVEFEESSQNHSFEVSTTSFTPRRSGAYLLSVAFYAPGFMRLNIGARFRDFSNTSSLSLMETIESNESVSLDYIPKESVTPSTPTVTGSLSSLWVGR